MTNVCYKDGKWWSLDDDFEEVTPKPGDVFSIGGYDPFIASMGIEPSDCPMDQEALEWLRQAGLSCEPVDEQGTFVVIDPQAETFKDRFVWKFGDVFVVRKGEGHE